MARNLPLIPCHRLNPVLQVSPMQPVHKMQRAIVDVELLVVQVMRL